MGFARIIVGYLVLSSAELLSTSAVEPPKIGDIAPNFTLKTIDNKSVELRQLTEKGKVALVVLRGWPGYQCPLCEQQVHDLVGSAAEWKERNVQILFIYPGPADQLKDHAKEFLNNKEWPKDFLLVLDPNYKFTTDYGLRWDLKGETAYPSTFLIDSANKIRFEKISKEHGGRVGSRELLRQIETFK